MPTSSVPHRILNAQLRPCVPKRDFSKLDLHLGTDAETTLILDESRLRLTPRQPDAEGIHIVHSLPARSDVGCRHCDDACVGALRNISLQLVENQEGRLGIRNWDC